VAEKEEIEGIAHWLADEGIGNVYTVIARVNVEWKS